jgi:hypothetical protein
MSTSLPDICAVHSGLATQPATRLEKNEKGIASGPKAIPMAAQKA